MPTPRAWLLDPFAPDAPPALSWLAWLAFFALVVAVGVAQMVVRAAGLDSGDDDGGVDDG